MSQLQTSPDDPYLVAFSYAPEIGPASFAKIVDNFPSVKDAYHANIKKLEKITRKNLQKFAQFRRTFKPYNVHFELINKNVQIINYSLLLKLFDKCSKVDIPICLYAVGNTNLLLTKNISIAIIGTRKPTSYGKEMAEIFTSSLSRSGIIVLSGLAIGIDSIAHSTALSTNGTTVAVLGNGITEVYPQTNLRLYNRLLSNEGLVLSEYPPGVTARPSNFILRNRIIAGLAHGVLIVEGGSKSGTLITARKAFDYGKDVFAIPGNIDSPMSQAPNLFIQQGAYLVMSPDDILQHYKISQPTLSKNELEIIKYIRSASLSAQNLAQKIGRSLPETSLLLAKLEADNRIIRLPDNTYCMLQ